ncbi:MAG: MaoC family dehydratase [Litoreibacter sp.]|nr:MaoC family dehydratase [Litoreibacter sp.]
MSLSVSELAARTGQEVGVSRWFLIDQARIDAFAELCEDHQYIHVSTEKAAQTPFGGTIAHGFLTLSLLSAMAYDAQSPLAGETLSVNYGFNAIRFLSPVRAGSRVRGRFAVKMVDERRPGEVTVTWGVTVEIEGEEKPALVAEWISRRYLDEAAH